MFETTVEEAMMRKLTIVGMTAALLITAPGVAAGGGWWSWIDLENRTVAIGETVTIRSEVSWATMEEAERARDGRDIYHAYLMPSFDANLEREMYKGDYKAGWWEPQPGSIDLGVLSFDGWNSNIGRGNITFEVPDVEPHRHFLMLCTAGCEHELGHMVPTELEIVASSAHAAAANRSDRLQEKLWAIRYEKRREIRKLTRALHRERDRIGTFDEQLASMNQNIEAIQIPQPSPPGRGLPDSSLLAIGALVGALAAYLLTRSRRAVPAPEPYASPAPLGVSVARSRPERSERTRHPLSRIRSRD
jgi:hypothetical protein